MVRGVRMGVANLQQQQGLRACKSRHAAVETMQHQAGHAGISHYADLQVTCRPRCELQLLLQLKQQAVRTTPQAPMLPLTCFI